MNSCVEGILNILEHLNENTTFTNYNDYVSAVEILCNYTQRINAEDNGNNKTAIANMFKSFCCNNSTVLSNMCHIYLQIYYDIKLNCTRNTPVYMQPLFSYDIATYILMALLIPMGLSGNLIILYTILKRKCLPIQTGYFLSSLTLADLGTIVHFGTFVMYRDRYRVLPYRVRMVMAPSFDIFFAAVSLLQITLISVERAIAVTCPLKYPSYISAKRAKIFVYIIWVVSFLLFLYSLSKIAITHENYWLVNFYVTASLLLFIPIGVIIISYTFILYGARQILLEDQKRIRMLSLIVKHDKKEELTLQTSYSSCNRMVTRFNSNLKCGSRTKEIKLALKIALIVLPFLCCWGYFVFIHMYEILTNYTFTGIANWLMFVLPLTASCLNPFLYLIFTRSLRQSIKSLIAKNVCRLCRLCI